MRYSLKKYQAKEERAEHGNYLASSFNITHAILLVACAAALVVLIIMLISVLDAPYEKFYFDSRPITYIFFVLILLLGLLVIGVALLHVFNRDAMPTYDEFKRAQNRMAYLKKKTRFPELLDFDANNPEDFVTITTPGYVTLESFCNEFRDYMADNLGLYYTKEDIRAFIASLGVSKMMVLQGMSGTGKTSIAVAFGKFIDNLSTVVPVQPMWKERSDLLGYYNEFTGKFNETTILKKLYEANFSDKMFIIVLDEMNIARVEYYFSEFLSLLELPPSSERKLVAAANGAEGDPRKMSHGKIVLPNNVWFLGTANNDDSTFAISDKVYDRAMVMNLNNRAAPYASDHQTGKITMSATVFSNLVEEAKRNATLSDASLVKIKALDEYLVHNFHITFGNRIMMQIRNFIPVYMACGGSEYEALDDIISKKILRKLEAKNPVFVKNKAPELITKFDELFGTDVMKQSIGYINTLVNNI